MGLRQRLQRSKEKPKTKELGSTGSAIIGGVLWDRDYNTNLDGDRGLNTFEEMRKSDGQVKAGLLACELPLRAARWEIKPASEDPRDQQIAQEIQDHLDYSMEITWDEFLRHTLLMLPFGFSVFEKVWMITPDGKAMLKTLAPRLPKSIYEFRVDPEGLLTEVVQLVLKDDKMVFAHIPAKDAVVFTLDKEGSNYRGVSLLRAAYKHWYFKNQLYRIDAMAAERHGLGLPVFTMPEYGGDTGKNALANVGERLHAGQKNYVVLPSGYDMDLKGVSGQLHNTMLSIEHHNIQITRSILAQFLNLGTGEVGSYALSKDQSSFFLLALQAVSKLVCDTFNRHVIRQWVDYNYSGVSRYPQLQVSGLEIRDLQVWGTGIATLAGAGALTTDASIEDEVRRQFRLPAKKQEPSMAARSKCSCEPPKTLTARLGDGTVRLSNTRLAEINSSLDNDVKELVGSIESVQKKQVQNLTKEVVKIIARRDASKLENIDVRYKGELAESVTGILLKTYAKGQDDVRKEMKKPTRAAALDNEEFIKAKSKALVSVLSARLKAAAVWAATNQIAADVVDEAVVLERLTSLSSTEAKKMANSSVSQAYGLGRLKEASRYEVKRVYRQALNDENTCTACAELDGKEWDYKDEEWQSFVPPDDANCDGLDRCRCVLVFDEE